MSEKGKDMQNVTPFPTKIEVVQPTKIETPQQQLSFLKMIAAIVLIMLTMSFTLPLAVVFSLLLVLLMNVLRLM